MTAGFNPIFKSTPLYVPCLVCHAKSGVWCTPPYKPLHQRRVDDFNHMKRLAAVLQDIDAEKS